MALSSSNNQNDLHRIDLNFDGLIARFKGYFSTLRETRKGANRSYKMSDAALGAFSVFFTQQPSFLAHQKLLEKKHHKSNAKTLFDIDDIPSDNQIRTMLDPLAPEQLTPLFDDLCKGLYEQGYLENFQSIHGSLLIALDATQQLSSKKIHCQNCSTQQHQNGEITYSHKVITPVIVAPGKTYVISLTPEFILPQDGHDKQDSEHAASKRWLDKHGHKYKKLATEITILGDDLYGHQPLCEAILAQKMHFILTCKRESHKTLYEWVDEIGKMNKIETLQIERRHGKKKYIDTYRFINNIPLRDGDDALMVNWCELTTDSPEGKRFYQNTYITDYQITRDNIAIIVSNGRARWHIENGNNNTLKTKGYHLTHNYGHGKQHLAAFLLSLNLLAFLFHTILQLHDKRYHAIRQELPTRKMFFQSISTLTTFMVFENWLALMEFMMDGLEISLDSG